MFRFTVLLTLMWLPALLVGYEQFGDFFYWRHQLTLYTGVLSLGYMCMAALLAARFKWVESIVQGLDKGYAVHKNLGIGATVTLIFHWAIVKSAHWLIDAQMIAPPNRGSRPELTGVDWRGIAEQVGDISFKVFLIFSLISLIQAISYKKFKSIHKLGGVLVLVGVFHSVLLLDWNIESLPMNITIFALSAIGIWCSCLSLLGKIGKGNKVTGKVADVKKFTNDKAEHSVIRFSIQLEDDFDYKEGQFAYLDFHDGEAPHPFSVLDYDQKQKLVSFGIKDLGDYTHHLVNTLSKQQKVTIEGSYGKFQISNQEHQVWIGAGIGIVPFISRLYWLNRQTDKTNLPIQKVELFYCVNSQKEAFFQTEIVKILNELKFIELHIIDAEKGQLLDGAQITNKMAGKAYDVSFCGPSSFSNNLQSYLFMAGLPTNKFHKEIFKMR